MSQPINNFSCLGYLALRPYIPKTHPQVQFEVRNGLLGLAGVVVVGVDKASKAVVNVSVAGVFPFRVAPQGPQCELQTQSRTLLI